MATRQKFVVEAEVEVNRWIRDYYLQYEGTVDSDGWPCDDAKLIKIECNDRAKGPPSPEEIARFDWEWLIANYEPPIRRNQNYIPSRREIERELTKMRQYHGLTNDATVT